MNVYSLQTPYGTLLATQQCEWSQKRLMLTRYRLRMKLWTCCSCNINKNENWLWVLWTDPDVGLPGVWLKTKKKKSVSSFFFFFSSWNVRSTFAYWLLVNISLPPNDPSRIQSISKPDSDSLCCQWVKRGGASAAAAFVSICNTCALFALLGLHLPSWALNTGVEQYLLPPSNPEKL